MILVDNIITLKKIAPDIYGYLKPLDLALASSPIKQVASKSGQPSLALEADGQLSFIHSKYDPVKEAQSIIDGINADEVGNVDQIFFYGIGLGYHIEAFLKKFPNKFFTLYEPNPDVFCHYLSNMHFDKLPLKYMKELYIELTPEHTERNAGMFLTGTLDRLLFVALPSYERLFEEDFSRFTKFFKLAIKDVLSSRATMHHFQKNWTINSMRNFCHNLVTPSIFNCDTEQFKNKPAILAAAGPSLTFEYENIRKIREKNQAYIFTIGSAIKALVTQDIHPHGTASMDPGAMTIEVFTEMIAKGITDIPLIYGTSIGYEGVEHYPGPKLFMLMDRDNITPYYLPMDQRNVIEMVGDAPTIAITTLQLLLKLGFNPIILAGQNLAHLDNRNYADGIKYSNRDHMTKPEDVCAGVVATVIDVYGNEIETQHAYNLSKKIMEGLIAAYPGTRVINTTKGGAAISGAPFVPLEDVMARELSDAVAVDDWYVTSANNFDCDYILERDRKMEKARDVLPKLFESVDGILKDLAKNKTKMKESQINAELNRFDKSMKALMDNDYFRIFITPMLMIELSALSSMNAKIRIEKSYSKRADIVIEYFSKFSNEAKIDIARHSDPLYLKIRKAIKEYVEQKRADI
jgi:hypothetical protein